MLSQSHSGYLHNVIIYYGEKTELTQMPGLSHTINVVVTLMTPLANKVYDLYGGHYYISPQLARKPLEIVTTITGTVIVSKRGMYASCH